MEADTAGTPHDRPAGALSRGVASLAGRRVGYHRGGPRGVRRLLYLHDAGADTLAAPALTDLARDHDTVSIELPGYGASDPPAGLASASAVADVVVGLLDHLGWAAATVAGTSLGGWFAAELALTHPTRVAALLLAGSAGLHTPEDYLFALFADGQAAAGTEELIGGVLRRQLPPHERDVAAMPAALAAATIGPYVQDLAAAAAASWHPARVNPRLQRRLAAIRCRTTVLWGEHDALIPLAHGRAFAAAIAGAQLRIVAGGGHLLARDAPDAFSQAVRDLGR